MDWYRRGLKQFRTVPAAERIPVLLSSPAALDHLPSGALNAIPDERSLRKHIDSISARLRTHKVNQWIEAITATLSAPVLTPDGFPGRISFPIIPFRSANSELVRPIQYIDRDLLSVESFLEYFGLFKNIPETARPRVIFADTETSDTSIAEFFSDISDLVDLYHIFPDGLRSIEIPARDAEDSFRIDLLAHGSHHNVAHKETVYPERGADYPYVRKSIIENYYTCIAMQRYSDSFSREARREIGKMHKYLDDLISSAPKEQIGFLLSAKIQFLLLKILVDDDDSDSLYEAIALSKAIDSQGYEHKCLRFANQISGVSSYAISQLESSIDNIQAIHTRESDNPIHILEYLAACQNLFITRLFNRKNIVDSGEAEACLQMAEEQYRYFNELGMLANSVGLSYLVEGRIAMAIEFLQNATGYSADRMTHLNIRCNLYIARHMEGEKISSEKIAALFSEYKTLKFTAKTSYHAAMLFGNLWQLAADKSLRNEIEEEARKRKFISPKQHGQDILPQLRRRGFLFMKQSAYTGPFGSFIENSGFMPAFHFNWSTPVTGTSCD